MSPRVLVFLVSVALYGQAQQTAPPAQPTPTAAAGLETSWEIAPVLNEISAHAGRLLTALDRVDARSWVNKGASETYLEQLQSSKQQSQALVDGAKALARNPENLAAGLVVFFRIQALEAMVGSLEEGLRRYQSADEASRLASLAAENGANRDRFQNYLINLAADEQQRLQVMDQEAQRCRAMVATPPARTVKKK